MVPLLTSRLRDLVADWVRKRHPIAQRELFIQRNRIYILPTRGGLYFAFTVVVLFIGATNYNNNLAMLFTFLLAGIGGGVMWQTHRNLLNLRIERLAVSPVFAGDPALFRFAMDNPSAFRRYGLTLRWKRGPETRAELPPRNPTTVTVSVPTKDRGHLVPGRFTLSTTHPLGLFRAWSWVEFDLTTLVYPKPAPTPPTPPSQPRDGHRSEGSPVPREGSDDYIGLRKFLPGDPPGHLAWKVVARTGLVFAKQFASQSDEVQWLDWDALAGVAFEDRLSMLCALVLQAHDHKLVYGLRLPTATIGFGAGEGHKKRCLRALALFPSRLDWNEST